MRPDKRAFLNYRDLKIADLFRFLKTLFDQFVVPFYLSFQMQSRRQIRRSGTDKNHIHFDLFAFDHNLFVYAAI